MIISKGSVVVTYTLDIPTGNAVAIMRSIFTILNSSATFGKHTIQPGTLAYTCKSTLISCNIQLSINAFICIMKT